MESPDCDELTLNELHHAQPVASGASQSSTPQREDVRASRVPTPSSRYQATPARVVPSKSSGNASCLDSHAPTPSGADPSSEKQESGPAKRGKPKTSSRSKIAKTEVASKNVPPRATQGKRKYQNEETQAEGKIKHMKPIPKDVQATKLTADQVDWLQEQVELMEVSETERLYQLVKDVAEQNGTDDYSCNLSALSPRKQRSIVDFINECEARRRNRNSRLIDTGDAQTALALEGLEGGPEPVTTCLDQRTSCLPDQSTGEVLHDPRQVETLESFPKPAAQDQDEQFPHHSPSASTSPGSQNASLDSWTSPVGDSFVNHATSVLELV